MKVTPADRIFTIADQLGVVAVTQPLPRSPTGATMSFALLEAKSEDNSLRTHHT